MRKAKKVLVLLVAACLLCAGLSLFEGAAAVSTVNGACGTNVTWGLDTATGVLTVSGTGAMSDTATLGDVYSLVKTAYISQGITSIGAALLRNCLNLRTLSLPDSVTSVGNSAFMNCSKLTDIYYGGPVERHCGGRAQQRPL